MSPFPYRVHEHIVPCQHIREYPRATRGKQEDVLYLHVKQYCPDENPDPKPGDVTIIAAHGNGFVKELYEPLWEDLLRHLKGKVNIRGIWMADVSNQGASGVLNERSQGDDPSWFDHSRDLLHMINHFRSQMPRPIVGIGHSMGGTVLANLSIIHPRLFSTLVLFDPVIQADTSLTSTLLHATNGRQDVWSSRADAEKFFRKSKFCKAWDPRVLERWIRYGLRPTPTELHPSTSSRSALDQVTLTTSKHQEAWTYSRLYFAPLITDESDPLCVDNVRNFGDIEVRMIQGGAFFRAEANITFANLPFLQPSLLYVFAEHSALSGKPLRDEKMELTGTGIGGSGGVKAGKVACTVIPKAGHLLTMENVDECAAVTAQWLSGKLKTFEADERREMEEGREKSEDGTTVSQEWQDRSKEWMLNTRRAAGKERL